MTDKIKLTRYRNIRLTRHEEGDELEVGAEVKLGQAKTLVRIGGAVWVPASADKSISPVKSTKAKKTKRN